MTDSEKKDMYIAAGVGGVALILILLYVHSAPAIAGGAGDLPTLISTPPVDSTPYNYNILPYAGNGPLNIPANGRSGSDLLGKTGDGSGCCDPCSLGKQGVNNPGVSAFLRLLTLGA